MQLGLEGLCRVFTFELSSGEMVKGVFCGTMALVSMSIRCSNLSKRVVWVDAFSPCFLAILANLASK